MRLKVCLLFTMLLLAPGAHAAVYKCRDAGGAVVYAEEPCEKSGTRQEKKLTRQELKANEMRMRAKPDSGATPSFSQGSNYQGAAPQRKPSDNNRD